MIKKPWPHNLSTFPNEICSPEDVDTLPNVEVTWYWGVDGVAVIEIDTTNLPEDSEGPNCRVYLNDGTIWANPDLGEAHEEAYGQKNDASG